MKKTVTAIMAALCILFALVCSASAADAVPTEAEAYQKIIALKASYPQGRRWTNANYYSWKGGPYGASGCMGFAFMVSDNVFGSLPARDIYAKSGNPITISQLRVGDILRLPGHSVVVLEKHGDYIIITEGNYQRSVHWGRKITAAQVKRASYYTTRYPAGYVEPTAAATVAPAPAPQPKKVAVTAGGKTYQVCDIDGHWAQEHIKKCVTSSLLSLSGTEASASFYPQREVTRAEAVTALYRAKGSPEPKCTVSFTDLTEDWYRKAISWAIEAGVASGRNETEFAPQERISREQLVTLMYRFAGSPECEVNLASYTDASEISEYARVAVSWAVKNGIMSGKDGYIYPYGTVTRAEFSAMIVRFSLALAQA